MMMLMLMVVMMAMVMTMNSFKDDMVYTYEGARDSYQSLAAFVEVGTSSHTITHARALRTRLTSRSLACACACVCACVRVRSQTTIIR
jgi:hypothetical protein